MYLIPKNIKTKREIFKGFGMLEILTMALSCGLGFLLQSLVVNYKLKITLFFLFPLITFLLVLPLPNGSTTLIILKKYIIYKRRQKKYKLK